MQQGPCKRGHKATPAVAFPQHGQATAGGSPPAQADLPLLAHIHQEHATLSYRGGGTALNSSGRPRTHTSLRATRLALPPPLALALRLCRGAAHSVTAMQSFVEVDGSGGQHEEEGGDHEADDGCEGQHDHHLGEGDLRPPGGRVLHRPQGGTQGGGMQGGRLTEAGQRQVVVLPRANAGSRIHNGGWRLA